VAEMLLRKQEIKRLPGKTQKHVNEVESFTLQHLDCRPIATVLLKETVIPDVIW